MVAVLISEVVPATLRFPVTTKSPAIVKSLATVASPAYVSLKISAVVFAI